MDIVDLRNHGQLCYDYSREKFSKQTQYSMHFHTCMEIYYLVRGNIKFM